MPDENIETDVVSVDWPALSDVYLPADWIRASNEVTRDEALIFVSIRIAVGRDSFNVRVLLDKNGTDDVDIIRLARRRAHVMLSDAAQATQAWSVESQRTKSL
jgi:hypothetical protein